MRQRVKEIPEPDSGLSRAAQTFGMLVIAGAISYFGAHVLCHIIHKITGG